VPELGRNDVREVFLRSYRIIYRVAGDDIRILRCSRGTGACGWTISKRNKRHPLVPVRCLVESRLSARLPNGSLFSRPAEPISPERPPTTLPFWCARCPVVPEVRGIGAGSVGRLPAFDHFNCPGAALASCNRQIDRDLTGQPGSVRRASPRGDLVGLVEIAF
jgi:hypothetical protein